MRKNEPISKFLYEGVKKDLETSSDWRDKIERLRKKQLGQHNRNNSYPRAPQNVEFVMDENVRDVTSVESRILWSSRNFANFAPMVAGMDEGVKRQAERGFDTMFRYILQPRRKLNTLLTSKNADGVSFAKLVENTNDYRRVLRVDGVLPDFDNIDPLDLVFPTETQDVRDAERVCHIQRLTERQLIDRGQKMGWNTESVDRVLSDCKKGADDQHQDQHGDGKPRMIGIDESDSSEDMFVIWEIYYIDNDHRRYRMIMCPDAPEHVLHLTPWVWPDTLEERMFPFVQFRFEDRSDMCLDSRGINEMLEHHQNQATQYSRVRSMQYDFFSRPFLENVNASKASLGTFKYQLGALLPQGTKFAQMPPVDQSLTFSSDMEYAKAARRVGAQQGSMTGVRGGSVEKTATQVQQEQQNQVQLSSESILRLAEPFGQLLTMMWEWLSHHNTPLPMMDRQGNDVQFQGMMSVEVYQIPFVIMPAAASQSLNPMFQLQQLTNLQSYFALGNQQGLVNTGELLRFVTDQVNPMLTDKIIADLNKPPIEQQIMQMQQQIQQMGQYMMAQAQSDIQEEQNEQLEKTVEQIVSEKVRDQKPRS